MGWKKTLLFWSLLLAVPVAVLAWLLPPAWEKVERALRPEVIAWVATHLPAEEKERITKAVASIGTGMFRIIPDPVVGRVARTGLHTVEKEAVIITNNAGMRSQQPYLPKPEGVFRILCLGDSFVFGSGGLEEDRFCRQIEDFYREQAITVQGKRIEALAVGLPSWNTQQEATYVLTRLDEYAPDLILMLTCQNDISDSLGVTEDGMLTQSYSSDQRARGSAVFSNIAGQVVEGGVYSALGTDLCAECRQYWQSGFAAVARLVELQHRRGGLVLLSGLEHPARHAGYFVQLFKHYAAATGAPWMLTGYTAGQESSLPHDGHPSRYGHRLLATHYIRALSERGWIPVSADKLPMEPRMHPENSNPPTDWQDVALHREKYIAEHLRVMLDFRQLDQETGASILGGLFPEQNNTLPNGQPLWASVRAGFLLALPAEQRDRQLVLTLQVPDRAPLFPMPLAVRVNGHVLATPVLEAAQAGHPETLRIPVAQEVLAEYPALEVILETPRYFSGIEDHRMKSYQILSAALE